MSRIATLSQGRKGLLRKFRDDRNGYEKGAEMRFLCCCVGKFVWGLDFLVPLAFTRKRSK